MVQIKLKKSGVGSVAQKAGILVCLKAVDEILYLLGIICTMGYMWF